jgi:ELWxxDGT repeat protein
VDRSHGVELWILDGSNQPRVAADIIPGPGGSYPSNLTVFKGKICFTANDSSAGNELFEYFPCYSDIKVIDTTVCSSYISPSGRYSWNKSGTYLDTIPNATGCDSLITVNLSIHRVNTVVVVDGYSLQAAFTGARYQWVDCGADYSPFTGDTNQSFVPLVPGTYAVIMNDKGCVDTSDCFTLVATSLSRDKSDQGMAVYPNPTQGNFTIDLGRVYSRVVLTITRYDGQIVRKEIILDQSKIDLELNEPPGIYTVIIITEYGEVNLKVIKN